MQSSWAGVETLTSEKVAVTQPYPNEPSKLLAMEYGVPRGVLPGNWLPPPTALWTASVLVCKPSSTLFICTITRVIVTLVADGGTLGMKYSPHQPRMLEP